VWISDIEVLKPVYCTLCIQWDLMTMFLATVLSTWLTLTVVLVFTLTLHNSATVAVPSFTILTLLTIFFFHSGLLSQMPFLFYLQLWNYKYHILCAQMRFLLQWNSGCQAAVHITHCLHLYFWRERGMMAGIYTIIRCNKILMTNKWYRWWCYIQYIPFHSTVQFHTWDVYSSRIKYCNVVVSIPTSW